MALQEQVDRLIGTQAAAEAAVIEGKELQALYSLPSLSGIDTEVARVVGYAANNLDQVIEINKGSASGIDVGHGRGEPGRTRRQGHPGHPNVGSGDARHGQSLHGRGQGDVGVRAADAGVPTNTSPSGLSPSEIAAEGTTHHARFRRWPGRSCPASRFPTGHRFPTRHCPAWRSVLMVSR